MLSCYFFGLCAGSSVDKDTNNFTLFSLIEHIGVLAQDLGGVVPIEAHAYFFVAEEGRHSQFELRVIRTAADGTEDPGGALPFQTEDMPRSRVRVRALRLPTAFGFYTLRLEWRCRDSDVWHAESVRWPLVLVDASEITAAKPIELSSPP